MRIHQQRVPIISPLDKDYYRSALSADLNADKYSDNYSFFDKSRSSLGGDRSGSPEEVGNITNISNAVNSLGFTIVGERDL